VVSRLVIDWEMPTDCSHRHCNFRLQARGHWRLSIICGFSFRSVSGRLLICFFRVCYNPNCEFSLDSCPFSVRVCYNICRSFRKAVPLRQISSKKSVSSLNQLRQMESFSPSSISSLTSKEYDVSGMRICFYNAQNAAPSCTTVFWRSHYT
jgi:hypothetical protein